jgi:nucleoid-associated protein YgaU
LRNILIAVLGLVAVVAVGAWLYMGGGELFGDETDKTSAPSAASTSEAGTSTESAKPAPAASGTGSVTPASAAQQAAVGTAQPVVRDSDASAAGTATPAPAPATDAAKPALPPPTFDVVRISPDGTAVIAGRAPAGSVIELSADGKLVARETANAAGEWVIVVDKPLPPGPLQLELTARLPDGGEVSADSVLAMVVPGRELPPDSAASSVAAAPMPQTAVAVAVPKSGEATKLLQKPAPAGGADALSLDKIDYDEAGNVVMSGSTEPGARVRVYVDNQPVGETMGDAGGQWQLRPGQAIAEGEHRLRVDKIGDGGAVLARVELPFARVSPKRLLDLPLSHRVVVQPGNSLWRIARRVYGEGVYFTVIYQANTSQIRNPDLIYPGQVFDLPKTDAGSEKAPGG